MLDRARALRTKLRERQSVAESLGRLPDETNQDFLDAGFYRIVQPRCFGGYEFSITDFIEIMIEISRGCPESGWVLALTSGHTANFIAGFPLRPSVKLTPPAVTAVRPAYSSPAEPPSPSPAATKSRALGITAPVAT